MSLEKGPGHFPASPFPGQAGESVIFGRSVTFGRLLRLAYIGLRCTPVIRSR